MSRAGHVTVHVAPSRPCFQTTKLFVISYYNITIIVVTSSSRHRDLCIFRILSGPWGSITLLRRRRREAIQLSRAQLCSWKIKISGKLETLLVCCWSGPKSIPLLRDNCDRQQQHRGQGGQRSAWVGRWAGTIGHSFLEIPPPPLYPKDYRTNETISQVLWQSRMEGRLGGCMNGEKKGVSAVDSI